jgi:prevent-host-death family protein
MTNIHEAKTHLSRLLDRVAAGEEIVIAKAGKPVARLVPYGGPARPERRPGYWKGKVRISADFDELPAEVMAAFRGERR